MTATHTRLRLTGLREAVRALRKLPDEIEPLVVERALTESAEPMRQAAEDLAPRRRPENSLADNIVVSTKLTSEGRQSAAAVRKDEAAVYVGPDMEAPGSAQHAHLVEFGSGPRYHESGKFVGQMPAQPFMRPAFDATKGVVVRLFGPKLWEHIRNNTKKLAGRVR